MITDFAIAWTKYKGDLQERIAESETHTSWNYDDLLKMLFETVVNPYLDEQCRDTFNLEDITTIDNGFYSGLLVFVLYRGCFSPCMASDYIYTTISYGSCSVCDTLQAIQADYDEWEDKLPNERQVKDYMSVCLNLLQNCYCMKEYE